MLQEWEEYRIQQKTDLVWACCKNGKSIEFNRRLTWFGHVARMGRVRQCHIRGNRSRGRQTKTRLDNIHEDMVIYKLTMREAVDMTCCNVIISSELMTDEEERVCWPDATRGD